MPPPPSILRAIPPWRTPVQTTEIQQGAYLGGFVSLPVVNRAIGGRSARSYTREGRFNSLVNEISTGDYVVIEFGHNDGGSLNPDNGRTDCGVGAAGYDTTCTSFYNGVYEKVLTYEKYLANAARMFNAKGVHVIISSPTPNNPWESGHFVYSASRFTGYSSDAATETGSVFTDHGLYTASLFKNKGLQVVNSYYPNDHTHTSPDGANTVARAFILGLEVTNSTLKNYMTHD